MNDPAGAAPAEQHATPSAVAPRPRPTEIRCWRCNKKLAEALDGRVVITCKCRAVNLLVGCQSVRAFDMGEKAKVE